jgi:hypothetical protein
MGVPPAWRAQEGAVGGGSKHPEWLTTRTFPEYLASPQCPGSVRKTPQGREAGQKGQNGS